jgi:hypothetical protein
MCCSVREKEKEEGKCHGWEQSLIAAVERSSSIADHATITNRRRLTIVNFHQSPFNDHQSPSNGLPPPSNDRQSSSKDGQSPSNDQKSPSNDRSLFNNKGQKKKMSKHPYSSSQHPAWMIRIWMLMIANMVI